MLHLYSIVFSHPIRGQWPVGLDGRDGVVVVGTGRAGEHGDVRLSGEERGQELSLSKKKEEGAGAIAIRYHRPLFGGYTVVGITG